MLPALFALAMGLIAFVLLVRDALALRRIPGIDPAPVPAPPPSVSVIIPARNEERTIAASAGGVLAQDYPDFNLTVINDHSGDRTGAILAELAGGDRRLAVIDGADLPAGWTGKCWACWQAARSSDGEWLLFLDADTRPQPGMIAGAIAHATAHNLDLLTLMPFV
ncbi:MAG TPA: glycosyltransferase, partial [Herpetosiphonaceae bacterium]|nr:glycosyltransferase [Herpetosiphonaceae bacterium]